MRSLSSKYRIVFSAIIMLCIFLFPALSIAADSSADKPLPSLLLSGALNAPHTITPCAPMTIEYSVKNTGTIPVSGGVFIIEITSAATGKSVLSQQIPFTMEPDPFLIESVNFPQGAYTITLRASVLNGEHKIARDITLAKQALKVSAPILIKKINGAMHRVLIWLNQNGTAIQLAFATTIEKQAFEEEGVYYMTVDTQADFREMAMSGEFNTIVLFETDELLEQTDWLMDRVMHGQGLVIIGSEDRTRMVAETFGFKFREAPPAAGPVLLVTEESAMWLSGTIPVSGRILQPQKKSAKAAALFAGNKKPAILIDKAGKGQVIVMPFSLTRSALETGSTLLYSLLLRAAVRTATPENDEQTGVSSIELLVSAPMLPIRAHVVETLPPGTKVIWTTAEGTVKNNTITYDLVADKETQSLRYLYQPPDGNRIPAVTEVFYECNGKLVSQGKIE